jgi:hypothetical protein
VKRCLVRLDRRSFFGPTSWTIGGGRLNWLVETFQRTPPLHQRNLLFQSSSTTSDPLPGPLCRGMAAYFRDRLRA